MEDANDAIKIMPEGFNQFDLNFKIIIVGDSGVGKSSLTTRATKPREANIDSIATVGFEFQTFIVKINNTILKLQIWDTCGQDVYKSLVANFYKSSSLAILCYAIDNKQSFENINNWLGDLRSNAMPETRVFLIGNKSDLENKRQISLQEAKKFKEENNIDFFMETSAKSGENSSKVFIEAAKILHSDYVSNPNRSQSTSQKSASNFSDLNGKINTINQNRKEESRIEDSSSGKCLVF